MDADERLADFFRSGIEPADVQALYPLRRAREALQALTTLFNGTEAAVLVRLLVLREIGGRGEQPFWTASEVRDRLAYIHEAKLENILGRLRGNGLLSWDAETSRYSVSPLGRMVSSALLILLKFGEEGSELGYIAGQLAASRIAGKVSDEELQHLLSRLNELKDEFDRAVLSGSEARIRKAEHRLAAAWHWVDKGTEVLRTITEGGDLDPAAHRVAQRIGQVQSSLLRMGGVFQRALNQLESQKVHLGTTGLSSADVHRWLRTQDAAALVSIAEDAITAVSEPSFVLADVAADIAEYELVDRERPDRLDAPLPPRADPLGAETMEVERIDFQELESLYDSLVVAPDGLALEHAVPLRDFELSSYRMSLLALIGESEPAARVTGPVASLARLNRRLEWTGDSVPVGAHGVEEMSEGRLRAKGGDDGE